MSKELGLPVYKSSYDLFLYSFQLIRNLNKDYKYTAGEKIKNEIMDMIMNIINANKNRDKKENIEKAQESIDRVRILFRLLKDLNQISLKNFAKVNF